MTNVLLIAGSPRARSNTGSIVAYLAERLEDLGAAVDVFHVTAHGPSDEELERLLAVARHCEAVVLAAPVYFDGLPAVTHALLERVHAVFTTRFAAAEAATVVDRESALAASARLRRRVAALERGARGSGGACGTDASLVGPAFYGVVHSGFVEGAQRRPALWTLELFARSVSWPWQGAVSFGGTSPIGGRPLDEVGRLAMVVREGLALAAREIVAGRPLSAETLTVCGRSPFAFLPRRVVIRLINARTRSVVRRQQIDVTALPYAD